MNPLRCCNESYGMRRGQVIVSHHGHSCVIAGALSLFAMNNFTGIAALLFLLLTTGIFGKDKPEEPNPEVEKAVEISNIRHSRMPAFRLSATITLTVDEKGPLEGKYVFLKSSDGNWREELFLPGYSRLRVGDEHNYWQARSLEYDPLPIQNIDDLLDFSRMLSFEKKRKLTRPSKIRKE